jgi:hypothetical protein
MLFCKTETKEREIFKLKLSNEFTKWLQEQPEMFITKNQIGFSMNSNKQLTICIDDATIEVSSFEDTYHLKLKDILQQKGRFIEGMKQLKNAYTQVDEWTVL